MSIGAYSSIQDAVDAAGDGDVIKVASGVYADVHVRPRNDITTTGFVIQVVYTGKTVTIATGDRPAPATALRLRSGQALRDSELDTALRAVEGLGGEQPGL